MTFNTKQIIAGAVVAEAVAGLRLTAIDPMLAEQRSNVESEPTAALIQKQIKNQKQENQIQIKNKDAKPSKEEAKNEDKKNERSQLTQAERIANMQRRFNEATKLTDNEKKKTQFDTVARFMKKDGCQTWNEFRSWYEQDLDIEESDFEDNKKVVENEMEAFRDQTKTTRKDKDVVAHLEKHFWNIQAAVTAYKNEEFYFKEYRGEHRENGQSSRYNEETFLAQWPAALSEAGYNTFEAFKEALVYYHP